MAHLEAINPLYSLSGLLVGLLVGITGVGGGSLMTPILVLLFGVHPATAVGTDLLYASLTKTGGTLVHHTRRTVAWPIVLRLAVGSIPASIVTLLALHRLGMGKQTGALITTSLGVALLLTAMSLFFRERLLARAQDRSANFTAGTTGALTILAGAALGALVSLSSVGAGALGVTMLVLLYPRLPILRIVGTDIAHAVPLTFVAGMGHWAMGSVDLAMLGSLLLGSLPGITLGSWAAPHVPERILRPILATTLCLVGAKLVF